MKTSDFNYYLPKELIAQHPLKNRENSRLLTIDKENHNIEHKHFYDIVDYLQEGDVLVLNNTRVIPGRIFGSREYKQEKIEFLLLTQIEDDVWECLVKPGKKAKIGTKIKFSNRLCAEVIDISSDGNRFIKFDYDGIFEEILEELGEMPLPPYITEKLDDKERYQTVYSKIEGSAAAPTAGLHFTYELLDKIKKKGIEVVYITLHVGLGTFRPVKVDDVLNHNMHSEFYMIDEDVAKIINKAKIENRRIISVGTTSTRALESCSDSKGMLTAYKGWTDIFIYPGYQFKCVDAIITNFHLPESTLIMLVSAFLTREYTLDIYKTAVEKRYRFFSFGDAMFIY